MWLWGFFSSFLSLDHVLGLSVVLLNEYKRESEKVALRVFLELSSKSFVFIWRIRYNFINSSRIFFPPFSINKNVDIVTVIIVLMEIIGWPILISPLSITWMDLEMSGGKTRTNNFIYFVRFNLFFRITSFKSWFCFVKIKSISFS